jgi:SAM-dependent methyltransferase
MADLLWLTYSYPHTAGGSDDEGGFLMAVQQTIDEARVEAFVGKVLGDAAGTMAITMVSIGDELGLFKSLAANGPATSVELAARTNTNERYVREWLAALTSAEYLVYNPTTERFTLPTEHALVLAQEGGPAFLGGGAQQAIGMLATRNGVVEAFRHGGGVANDAFDPSVWDGLARISAPWVENQLVQNWLPLMPEVQARLERGVALADVGAGYGQAIIRLAQAFPASRFVGYDINERSIARARSEAERSEVSDRVRFVQLDATSDLPEQYDLITTFDVIHDTASPLGTLRVIRRALKPDGIYICQEPTSSAHLEDNVGPVSALLYGVSVLFCMTQSLAAHGEGLGAFGLPETRLRELATEAGFGSLRQAPIQDPLNSLYELRPSVGGI